VCVDYVEKQGVWFCGETDITLDYGNYIHPRNERVKILKILCKPKTYKSIDNYIF
jgi:hypothetical protein